MEASRERTSRKPSPCESKSWREESLALVSAPRESLDDNCLAHAVALIDRNGAGSVPNGLEAKFQSGRPFQPPSLAVGISSRGAAAQPKACVTSDAPEIRIRAQELRADIETRLGDDAVHRASNGNALASQRPEEARRPDVAADRRFDDGQSQEGSPSSPVAAVGPEPLKNFRDDDRDNSQVFFFVEGGVEAPYVRSRSPIEEVGPGVGVYDDHPRVERAERHSTTSPFHGSSPLRRRNAR